MLRLAFRLPRQIVNQLRPYSAENVQEFNVRAADGKRISSEFLPLQQFNL